MFRKFANLFKKKKQKSPQSLATQMLYEAVSTQDVTLLYQFLSTYYSHITRYYENGDTKITYHPIIPIDTSHIHLSLFILIDKGNISLIRPLLNIHGVDVEKPYDPYGSLLSYASRMNNNDIIRLLTEHMHPVRSEENVTSSSQATSSHSYSQSSSSSSTAGNSSSSTADKSISFTPPPVGHPERMLFEAVTDQNKRSIFTFLTNYYTNRSYFANGEYKVAYHPAVPIDLTYIYLALFMLIDKGNIDLIKALLKIDGIDVNSIREEVGDSLLSYASLKRNVAINRLLTEHISFRNDTGQSSSSSSTASNATLVVRHASHHAVNDKTNYFLNAVMDNKYESVIQFLYYSIKNSADLNASNSNGNTALMLAACLGHTRIVKLLLDYSVSQNHPLPHPYLNLSMTNIGGSSALMLAARAGHVHIVELLVADRRLAKQDKDQVLTVMKLLVTNNVPNDLKSIYFKIIDCLSGYESHHTQSHSSERSQSSTSSTAILQALNTETSSMPSLTTHVASPSIDWFEAVMMDENEIVIQLLSQPGIDINKKNQNGNTGLILAVKNNAFNTVIALLADSRLNLLMTDNQGHHAIWHAVYLGRFEILQAILTKFDIKNEANATLLSELIKIANDNGHTQIKSLLSQYRATEATATPTNSQAQTEKRSFQQRLDDIEERFEALGIEMDLKIPKGSENSTTLGVINEAIMLHGVTIDKGSIIEEFLRQIPNPVAESSIIWTQLNRPITWAEIHDPMKRNRAVDDNTDYFLTELENKLARKEEKQEKHSKGPR